jgi:hypothetical protein
MGVRWVVERRASVCVAMGRHGAFDAALWTGRDLGDVHVGSGCRR